MAVTDVRAVPDSLPQGDETQISVDIENQGDQDETNLTLTLTLDGFGPGATEIDSAIVSLDASQDDTAQFTWDHRDQHRCSHDLRRLDGPS